MPRGRPLKRSKVKQKTVLPAIDRGTNELRQHNIVEETRKNTFNITQTPVDWYYARKWITSRQHEAASKLWELAEKAGTINLKVQSYDPTAGCSKGNVPSSDFYTSAPEHLRKKINKAMQSLSPKSRKIITDVVIYGQFVYRLENTAAKRSALMASLRIALDELAGHWEGEKRYHVV